LLRTTPGGPACRPTSSMRIWIAPPRIRSRSRTHGSSPRRRRAPAAEGSDPFRQLRRQARGAARCGGRAVRTCLPRGAGRDTRQGGRFSARSAREATVKGRVHDPPCRAVHHACVAPRGHRVPGIVRWPGKIQPHTESDLTVVGSDFYPTVLAAAGLEPPAGRTLDGVNLLPAPEDGREPLSTSAAGAGHDPTRRRRARGRASCFRPFVRCAGGAPCSWITLSTLVVVPRPSGARAWGIAA